MMPDHLQPESVNSKTGMVHDDLPLPPNVVECLRRHASDRAISKRKLIRLIVTAWCATVTDWNHPRFKDSVIPIEPVKMPDESMPGVWPGLMETLIVFTTPSDDAPAVPGTRLGSQP
jgi:hypothetical protein